MSNHAFNFLIHHVGYTLYDLPSYKLRGVVLNLFIDQEVDIIVHVVADDLCLSEQQHIDNVDGMVLYGLSLVWV